jgi:hypothetical protein
MYVLYVIIWQNTNNFYATITFSKSKVSFVTILSSIYSKCWSSILIFISPFNGIITQHHVIQWNRHGEQ